MTKWNSLRTRIISGLTFGVILLGSLLLGKWVAWTLFAVISFFLLDEYFKFFIQSENRRYKYGYISTLVLSLSLAILIQALNLNFPVLAFVCIYIYVLSSLLIIRKEYASIYSLFISGGILYIIIPIYCIIQITVLSGEYNPKILFWMLILIWVNDIGAYFIGSAIGRHKLSPSISPNKTWEGTIGGIVICAVVGFYSADLILITPLQGIIMGTIVGITATLGDLYESMLKRKAEVKDSGNLLPGHGGLLDRLDSLLFVAPVVLLLWKYWLVVHP